MIKKLLLASIMLAVFVFANAQKKNKPISKADPFAGLDTTFERILSDWHAAGFAVAVVEKDKVIYAKGFGYRDLENKIPVTPNTLFAIGSCTKAFTASILGILQKDGKLELNKPVRNYLPELKFFNDNMNNQIQLVDMMSHRTGLPRHDYSWYAFPSSSRDSLMKRIQYMEPSYGLREKWQYNNFMFLLQGMVAEKITGTSWENNVQEKIFKPLGMNSSNFSITDLQKNKDASLGYGLKKDSIIKKLDYYNINAMGPAGSINSNVLDMANWVSTWINGGKFNGKEIIPAGYMNEAMGAQMVVGTGLPTKERPDVFFSNYGFGWMLASYKGHFRVEHGGNIDGFSASTCFFPSDSVGIIVLTNQNGSSMPSIIRNTIADRILKLPYFDWNEDLKKSVAKAKLAEKEGQKSKVSNQKLNTHPSHPLKDYEGLYNHPGYGTFEVSLRNDSLICYMGKDVLWLKNYHYDIFEPFDIDPKDGIDTTDRSPTRVAFQMNEAGDINGIKIALEPTLPELKFDKTPKPKEITVDDLKKYIGEYDLAGAALVKVYIKNNKTLFVFVPGQPEYELVAVEKDKFSLKVLNGYFVQFDLTDKGVSTGLTFIQPNGNFKAKKK
ncbi:MAG: serine hydrolase [Bacteroidetes bacterium]|nr:serine hydrolase [Bacteroidota bacterium]